MPPSKKVMMSLHQKQGEVFNSDKQYRTLVAGRKFGKSTLALAELMRSAQTKKNNVYIAPTYKMARNTLWRDHIEKFLPVELIADKNETELRIELTNGNTITCFGSDNPDRLRGQNLDFVILDEFQDFKPTSWELVIEPNLLTSKGRALFMGTPKGLNNILYDQFKMKDKMNGSFHFTSYDNPLNSKELLASRKKRLIGSGKEDVWRQEYMAQFTKVAGLVYNIWDSAIHIKEMEISPGGAFGFSVDRGLTNPTAVGFYYIYREGNEDRVHMFDEIYQTDMSVEETVQKMRAKMGSRPFSWRFCDPSAKDFIKSATTDHGFYIQAASKETGGTRTSWVLDGISKCKDWLALSPVDGKPKFTVSPNCTNFIDEITSYIWLEEMDQEKNAPDRPRKLNDHHVDQWRYFIGSYKPVKTPFRRTKVRSYGRKYVSLFR